MVVDLANRAVVDHTAGGGGPDAQGVGWRAGLLAPGAAALACPSQPLASCGNLHWRLHGG